MLPGINLSGSQLAKEKRKKSSTLVGIKDSIVL